MICIKDEIIIKFKKNALNLEKLCYTYQGPPANHLLYDNWYEEQKSTIMSQQFPIDTIVIDSNLKSTIKGLGGLYLMRITSANPCKDTLSITRFGDTIEVENYLWMKLKLNNDTSVINTCLLLTVFYQSVLDEAEPNFCGYFDATPIDTYYNGTWPQRQESLHPFLTDVETAWDYQRGGAYDIKIGIIDDGIDYGHCDLSNWKGAGEKVVDGWNYVANSSNFLAGSTHGTPVSGIIGALTNGSEACTNPGVAGIALGAGTLRQAGTQPT